MARRAEKSVKQQTSRVTTPLDAKTATQAELLRHLRAGSSVFAIGPAGTGKTYLPSRIAARRLIDGNVERIIICRVTSSDKRHQLGFLPGKLEAKLEPWLKPVIEGLRAEMSAQTFDKLKTDGHIEFCSFEHMRGRTFGNCVVILDEAQNATFSDLALFLTRQGENAQVIVTGDLDQVDIHDSGLDEIIDLGDEFEVPMEIVEFLEDDVVRSPHAKAWVKALARRKERLGLRSANASAGRTFH
jgi:phosphate starvation-inducible PhoH-like protein